MDFNRTNRTAGRAVEYRQGSGVIIFFTDFNVKAEESLTSLLGEIILVNTKTPIEP